MELRRGGDRPEGKVAAIPSPTPSTPSSTSSNPSAPFAADAVASGAGMSSSAASGKRVTWRHPVVAGMTMVPNAVTRRFECDEAFEFLELEQAAIKEMAAQWAEAEEEKKQEEEKQVMAKVTLWSKVYRKNKFLDRKGRRKCFSNRNSMESLSPKSPTRPHVDYQTIPMAEVSNHYSDHLGMGQGAVPSNVQDLCRAYSEVRPVKGDGECFYRSFILSYLDTDQEVSLLLLKEWLLNMHILDGL